MPTLSKQLAMRAAKLTVAKKQSTADPALPQLVMKAGPIVEQLSGLSIGVDSLRVVLVSRTEWVERNVDAYLGLIDALELPNFGVGMVELNSVALGALLGLFSNRVIGQYDPALVNGEPMVMLVGENLTDLSEQLQCGVEEVALWVLTHELTHRAQFFSVPWLKEEVVALVKQLSSFKSLSPLDLLANVVDLLDQPAKFRNLDLSTVIFPPKMRALVDRLSVIMTLAEGQAEWVMRNLPAGFLDQMERFGEFVDQRRSEGGMARIIGAITGMTAKVRQYEQGLTFVSAVVDISNEPSSLVFTDREKLPTLAELSDPAGWLERVYPLAGSA